MPISKFSNPLPPRSPILVDSREASRMLSISPRKLWDLTFHREIPSLKIGRLVRYRLSDLHAWAEKRTQIPEL
jgi:excisionase family DNA binding protein